MSFFSEKNNVNLNQVKTQLAQRMTKEEVDTKVAQIVSGSPKGTYATLSALQTAYPTGTTGVYLVTADGKWYYWNDSTWTAGGTYQGTGISDGSITPTKTSFIKFEIGLNKYKTGSMQYVPSSTNKIYGDVYLEPSTTYMVRCLGADGITGQGGTGELTILDSNSTILYTIVNWAAFNGNTGATFTTGSGLVAGWYKLRWYMSGAIPSDWLSYKWMTFKGTESISYIDYKESYHLNGITASTEGIDDKSVTPVKTDFLGVYNIYPIWTGTGYWISPTDGVYVAFTGYKATKDYYSVNANKKYYYNKPCFMVFYDANKNFLSSLTRQSDIATFEPFVTIPNNAVYVRFSIKDTVDVSDFTFIMSTTKVSFTQAQQTKLNPYYVLQNENSLPFQNVKLTTDGDSITAMAHWQPYLTQLLGFNHIKNCAIGGTKVTDMCSDSRVSTIPTDTQFLIIMGGTNDFGQTNNATPLGNINSPHDTTTFYGAYQLWLDKLYARIPNAIIVMMASPYKSDEAVANHLGLVLEQYREATRQIAYKYGYYLIDLRKEMGVNSLNGASIMSDGTHYATNEGAYRLAKTIINNLSTKTELIIKNAVV